MNAPWPNFDREQFLREYWQQKPLLIKNPWGDWQNPLEPDELAGLACEDEIESRLIVQQRDTWKLEHGPFPEARFAKLPSKNWTLLVQAVDHYVPEVAALLDSFRFLPNWRIDDVMVSYAADQGGVGPHFDQYDVFLIQGLGQRRWQIGAICDHKTPLLPHDELRLLANFAVEEEWLLEPGDILYLPPRYAHNGVAIGDDCMTYSVGFRALSRGELIGHWCDHVLATLNDDDRYTDVGITVAENPGEINAQALARLQRMATETLLDKNEFAQWFGAFSTQRKYPELEQKPEAILSDRQLRQQLEKRPLLLRHPASRFAFIRRANDLLLFVDGASFDCANDSARLAEQLCAQDSVIVAADVLKSSACVALLTALHNQGSLVFEDDD